PATPEFSTLSLHDALPICAHEGVERRRRVGAQARERRRRLGRDLVQGAHEAVAGERVLAGDAAEQDRAQRVDVGPGADPGRVAADRKSTRLNSSHVAISYA